MCIGQVPTPFHAPPLAHFPSLPFSTRFPRLTPGSPSCSTLRPSHLLPRPFQTRTCTCTCTPARARNPPPSSSFPIHFPIIPSLNSSSPPSKPPQASSLQNQMFENNTQTPETNAFTRKESPHALPKPRCQSTEPPFPSKTWKGRVYVSVSCYLPHQPTPRVGTPFTRRDMSRPQPLLRPQFAYLAPLRAHPHQRTNQFVSTSRLAHHRPHHHPHHLHHHLTRR